jgi:PTH1 family peptidyl-tRNA hydrolase
MITIIIGLGNPGTKFKETRHNVGFMVLDKFAEKNNFPDFNLQKKYNALISENIVEDDKIILAKPQTFMNESGKTAKELLKDNRSEETNLIVIHDDIDLAVGKMKIVKERGSAGHKGVESIINNIGNDRLIRFRIGIGSENSEQKTKAMSIVLKKFSKTEQKIIDETINRTAQAINLFIKEGLEKTMGEYNR